MDVTKEQAKEEAAERARAVAEVGERVATLAASYANHGVYVGQSSIGVAAVIVVAPAEALVASTPGSTRMEDGKPVSIGGSAKRLPLAAEKDLGAVTFTALKTAQDAALAATGMPEAKGGK